MAILSGGTCCRRKQGDTVTGGWSGEGLQLLGLAPVVALHAIASIRCGCVLCYILRTLSPLHDFAVLNCVACVWGGVVPTLASVLLSCAVMHQAPPLRVQEVIGSVAHSHPEEAEAALALFTDVVAGWNALHKQLEGNLQVGACNAMQVFEKMDDAAPLFLFIKMPGDTMRQAEAGSV